MIHLRNVCVEFDDAGERIQALDHVDLEAQRGRLILISGPSGSGKSTLLTVVAGRQQVSSGTCLVAGVSLAGASDEKLARLRREHVGVVFQENNLIREFTAGENAQVTLRARGLPKEEAEAQAAGALAAVGIADLGGRKPAQLSGGQRQRVGIARAIVGGRSVLVADEPTGALDTANSISIFELLRSLADSGVCVLVASHDPSASDYSDQVLHMRDGRLSEAVTA